MNVCIHYPLEPTRDCTKGPLQNSNLFLKPLIPSELEKTKQKKTSALFLLVEGAGVRGACLLFLDCFLEYQLF